MAKHFDALETRTPEVREAALFTALRDQIVHAKTNAPYFSKALRDVDPRAVTTRVKLAELPVTRKSEVMTLQRETPPFGGLTAIPAHRVANIYQSPGPVYEPKGFGLDYWRFARAMFAAGLRLGDVVHNTFSYHLTPAGAMVESGAHALGCAVIAAGTGNTELQAQIIAEVKPTAYVGTPSFLKILIEKAREFGLSTASLKKGLVSGEALPPPLRAALKELGVAVYQCYATADLGLIAYESEAMEGLIVDEGVIVELVEPGGTKPVAEGEVGEVVVTTFTKEYPLIRFGTGDLSAYLPGPSACGRTNARLRGWLGRADQSTKVRGMFVHPSQVMAVLGRHPEIKKGRLVVTQTDGRDQMTLHCETEGGNEALAAAVATTIQNVCKLRGEIVFAAPGSLAADGKLIDDQRKLT